MKTKATRRIEPLRVVLIATILFVALGYCSAAVSLRNCDAAVAGWLLKNPQVGSTQHSGQAEPARLFLPFVASVAFEKKCVLALVVNDERQLERGTRYYLTLFGAVMPLWTASDRTTVVS